MSAVLNLRLNWPAQNVIKLYFLKKILKNDILNTSYFMFDNCSKNTVPNWTGIVAFGLVLKPPVCSVYRFLTSA